jgi:HSP20 family protein
MKERGDMDRLKNEMEELFAELCHPRVAGLRDGFRPNVDVYRTADPATITVVVELAGVDPDAVNLAVVDGSLVLSGTRQRNAQDRRVYQHMEIDHGPFVRRVPLTEPIDADGIVATYDRGLLTVVLPVTPPRPRHVRVDVTRRAPG